MPTTLYFHLSVSMYVFNVKSYTYCDEDKKGIKKKNSYRIGKYTC